MGRSSDAPSTRKCITTNTIMKGDCMNSSIIADLVRKLNKCRDAYYNRSDPLIPDSEYDFLFDKLKRLENETGIILSNSPTQTV